MPHLFFSWQCITSGSIYKSYDWRKSKKRHNVTLLNQKNNKIKLVLGQYSQFNDVNHALLKCGPIKIGPDIAYLVAIYALETKQCHKCKSLFLTINLTEDDCQCLCFTKKCGSLPHLTQYDCDFSGIFSGCNTSRLFLLQEQQNVIHHYLSFRSIRKNLFLGGQLIFDNFRIANDISFPSTFRRKITKFVIVVKMLNCSLPGFRYAIPMILKQYQYFNMVGVPLVLIDRLLDLYTMNVTNNIMLNILIFLIRTRNKITTVIRKTWKWFHYVECVININTQIQFEISHQIQFEISRPIQYGSTLIKEMVEWEDQLLAKRQRKRATKKNALKILRYR